MSLSFQPGAARTTYLHCRRHGTLVVSALGQKLRNSVTPSPQALCRLLVQSKSQAELRPGRAKKHEAENSTETKDVAGAKSSGKSWRKTNAFAHRAGAKMPSFSPCFAGGSEQPVRRRNVGGLTRSQHHLRVGKRLARRANAPQGVIPSARGNSSHARGGTDRIRSVVWLHTPHGVCAPVHTRMACAPLRWLVVRAAGPLLTRNDDHSKFDYCL